MRSSRFRKKHVVDSGSKILFRYQIKKLKSKIDLVKLR